MKISVNQTRANTGIEYKVIVDEEEKYKARASKLSSMKKIELVDMENRDVLYTKYNMNRTSMYQIYMALIMAYFYIVNSVFGFRVDIYAISIITFIIVFKYMKQILFHKKMTNLKYLHTTIFNSDYNQIGEFFRQQVVYPIKAGYSLFNMIFNGHRFYFYNYANGKESGYYIYDNDVQIGATVKSHIKIDNNDTYEIYVIKGYEEYEQMFTMFMLLYDNFYEGNRNEVSKGKKTKYSM